jgi:hypothetical protein
VLLEVRHEPGEDPEVLLGLDDLRHAVGVDDTEVPRRRRAGAGLVPAGRDVAVPSLDDQQDLGPVEAVVLVVGPADVRHDGQVV